MNNFDSDNEKKDQVKVDSKDIIAICLAVYKILSPILILFFVMFSLIVFLILNIWIK